MRYATERDTKVMYRVVVKYPFKENPEYFEYARLSDAKKRANRERKENAYRIMPPAIRIEESELNWRVSA